MSGLHLCGEIMPTFKKTKSECIAVVEQSIEQYYAYINETLSKIRSNNLIYVASQQEHRILLSRLSKWSFVYWCNYFLGCGNEDLHLSAVEKGVLNSLEKCLTSERQSILVFARQPLADVGARVKYTKDGGWYYIRLFGRLDKLLLALSKKVELLEVVKNWGGYNLTLDQKEWDDLTNCRF